MKKVALFFVLTFSLFLYGCENNTALVFNKSDFLRTFNTRMEEEKLNYYMLLSLDQNKKGNNVELIGFNKTQDLEIVITFNGDGVLTRFGLLTNRVDDDDLNKIVTIIKDSFPNSPKYYIKEGVIERTGYKGIGYFLKN